MKLLRALLEEAKKAEIDPSQVTASDVSTYVRQVKTALKGKAITKSTVSSAVHDIVEDDPKFGANPKAVPKLVAAVCAKLCEAMGMSDEVAAKKIAAKIQGTPNLNMQKIQAYVQKYLEMVGKGVNDVKHLVALVHADLSGKGLLEGVDLNEGDDDGLSAAKEKALKHSKDNKCVQHVNKRKKGGYSVEDWHGGDDNVASYENGRNLKEALEPEEEKDDTTTVRFSASTPAAELRKELANLKSKMKEHADKPSAVTALKMAHQRIEKFLAKQVSEGMSPRAEAALSNRLEVSEGWDNDDEDADVRAADDEIKKRKIKMMSPRAEKALSSKIAKADKNDEDSKSKKSSKEVDESVDVEDVVVATPIKGSFLASLMQDYANNN